MVTNPFVCARFNMESEKGLSISFGRQVMTEMCMLARIFVPIYKHLPKTDQPTRPLDRQIPIRKACRKDLLALVDMGDEGAIERDQYLFTIMVQHQ